MPIFFCLSWLSKIVVTLKPCLLVHVANDGKEFNDRCLSRMLCCHYSSRPQAGGQRSQENGGKKREESRGMLTPSPVPCPSLQPRLLLFVLQFQHKPHLYTGNRRIFPDASICRLLSSAACVLDAGDTSRLLQYPTVESWARTHLEDLARLA